MDNISPQDLEWIVNEYPKVRQLGRVSKWIDDHIRTMSIIKGHPVNKPSCNCEHASYAVMASNMWEQHITTLQNMLAEQTPQNGA